MLVKHLKKSFDGQASSRGPMPSQPFINTLILISYRSKTSQSTKKFIEKESSLLAATVLRFVEGKSEATKNLLVRLILNARPNADQQRLLAKVTPLINGAGAVDGTADGLMAFLEHDIRRERAYAMMSGIFARMLTGPSAPKVKYTGDNKLLSQWIPNTQDALDYYQSNPERLIELMPQLVAQAILRGILGLPRFEMKFDNFLIQLHEGDSPKVLPIDVDYGFTERTLNDAEVSIKGARSLMPNDYYPDHKTLWDMMLERADKNAVERAISEMYERAAHVLTQEVIATVVDHVINQEGDVFGLGPIQRGEAIAFMRHSQDICVRHLLRAGKRFDTPDPLKHAPWLADMMQQVEVHAAATAARLAFPM